MVFLVLGHLGDAVDEIDRFGELVKFERPLDMLLLKLPFRDLLQAVFQFVRFEEIGHDGNTSNTPFCFCNGESPPFFSPVARASSPPFGRTRPVAS
jgi:hypothetical protein